MHTPLSRAVPLSALLLTLAAITAPAPSQSWVRRTTGLFPPERHAHSMVYDSVRDRCVLFGGWGHTAPNLNELADTWEWDGSSWLLRSPAASPTARDTFHMAFDPVRGRTVLFGGSGSGSGSAVLGDTWEYDGSTWISVNATGPNARQRHQMVYDTARQRIMLFGGIDVGCNPVYGDTWEFDGGSWVQRFPPTSPSARGYHAMAYDTTRQRAVLFGGQGSPVDCNANRHFDTWEWDGATWTLVDDGSGARPAEPVHHEMVYDLGRDVCVLFGVGTTTLSTPHETWEWNGTAWFQTSPATYPTPDLDHAMAYDMVRGTTVFFGGFGPSHQQTWEYTALGRIDVAGVTPAQGALGTQPTVTVSGSGFRSGSQVAFGATAATTTFVSSTQLQATVPVLPLGTYDITVTAPQPPTGTPPSATLVAAFTVCGDMPTVAAIAPGQVSPGAATPVVITGTGFLANPTVWIGSNAFAGTAVSSSQVTATLPPGLTLGAHDVAVENTQGPSCTSPLSAPLVGGLLVGDPPVIQSVSPTSGSTCGGTSVTITGASFSNLTQVTFGGVPATSIQVDTQTQTLLVETPPSGGLTGPVDVVVDTGITPAAQQLGGFTYRVLRPRTLSVSPAQGAFFGGTAVTLTGDNYCPASQVWFGDRPAASVVFIDDHTLQVTSPLRVAHSGSADEVVEIRVSNPDLLEHVLPAAFTYAAGLGTVRTVGPTPAYDYPTIQQAINASQDGDAVLLDPTIGVPGTADYSQSFSFNGKRILVTSSTTQRVDLFAPSPTATIVTFGNAAENADSVLANVNLRGGGRAIDVNNGSSPCILDVIIDDVNATGDGAGVRVRGGGRPVLRDVEIHTCTAVRGGGVAVSGSGPSGPSTIDMVGGEITGCTVTGDGGAVYVADTAGPIRLIGVTLQANNAGGNGGAVRLGTFSAPGTVALPGHLLEGCVILANDAHGMGGGVFCPGNTVATIRGGYIALNNPDRRTEPTPWFHGNGGAIAYDAGVAASGTRLYVRDCVLQGNRADDACARGGGLWASGNTSAGAILEVTGCEILGNEAQVGGGLAIEFKIAGVVQRNVIACNRSALLFSQGMALCPWGQQDILGPGVFTRDCTLTFVENTVHQNLGGLAPSGGGNGGGLHVRDNLLSGSQVRSNAFVANDGFGLAYNGSSVSGVAVSHNGFFGNVAGDWSWNPFGSSPTNSVLVDPQWTLPACGTLSVPTNPPPSRSVALPANSPYVDAGDPVAPVPVGGGANVDIGAYEYGAVRIEEFGVATPNTWGTPSMAFAGDPIAGNGTGAAVAAGLPPYSFGLLSYGTRLEPGLPLVAIGGPVGSTLLVQSFGSAFLPTDAFGGITLPLPIPNSVTFVGFELALQALGIDPDLPCGCSLPLTHSRGLAVRIGRP